MEPALNRLNDRIAEPVTMAVILGAVMTKYGKETCARALLVAVVRQAKARGQTVHL